MVFTAIPEFIWTKIKIYTIIYILMCNYYPLIFKQTVVNYYFNINSCVKDIIHIFNKTYN